MKKLLFSLFAATAISASAFSQTKAVVTATIKIPNARCAECKSRIETYLNTYEGVQQIVVNQYKNEAKVKYWTDRTDIEQIKTAISNAGYDADDVPAEEAAYKRLPKSCKKFEDGGGHPKPKTVPPSSGGR